MPQQEFTYNFKIMADSKEDAIKIMTALQKFARAGEVSDLEKLANKVEAKPSLIKTALKYI